VDVTSQRPSASTSTRRRFNAVKVFSATMIEARSRLGETVTDWIAAHPRIEVVDIVTTQSSDSRFHCIAISLFYWQDV
jgi:hypothetical protein